MSEAARVENKAGSGSLSAPKSDSAIPWWLWTMVVLGAFLMGAGGIIALLRPAMLVSPHDEINGAVHIYAGYLASRNLGLAIMLLAALSLRARSALSTLMLLIAFIQFLDGIIDGQEGRWVIVPGVVVLGLLFLIGSARLSGYPFWRIGAWKQTH
jgi:hypothetical protein